MFFNLIINDIHDDDDDEDDNEDEEDDEDDADEGEARRTLLTAQASCLGGPTISYSFIMLNSSNTIIVSAIKQIFKRCNCSLLCLHQHLTLNIKPSVFRYSLLTNVT